MCQCLDGGSCSCASSSASATGSKRKQPSGQPLDHDVLAQDIVVKAEEPGSSCCSSKNLQATASTSTSDSSNSPKKRSCCSGQKVRKSAPSASTPITAPSLVSETVPFSVPSLAEWESNPLALSNMLEVYSTPSTSTSPPDLLNQHPPPQSWISNNRSTSQLRPFPAQAKAAWPSSLPTPPPSTAFDDWVWGDILVPDSFLPPPPAWMHDAIAQGACPSCGPSCACGPGQCQCGHVQALQQSLLSSTSDPIDRAFAESVLGLPHSSHFVEAAPTAPLVGHQLWSAGSMPVAPSFPTMQSHQPQRMQQTSSEQTLQLSDSPIDLDGLFKQPLPPSTTLQNAQMQPLDGSISLLSPTFSTFGAASQDNPTEYKPKETCCCCEPSSS